MYNMEYLTERDLQYFEKKEALGEAIIISIDPMVLLSLDLDALFKEHDPDKTLTPSELEAFFKSSGMKPGQGNAVMEPDERKQADLENNLQDITLSVDERRAFLEAVRNGATDEELLEMLHERC